MKEELNKIYATELSGKLYPVEESFFIELETRQYSRRMAVLAEAEQCYSRKAFKDIKRQPRLGPSHSDSASLPSHFPLSQTDSPEVQITAANVV